MSWPEGQEAEFAAAADRAPGDHSSNGSGPAASDPSGVDWLVGTPMDPAATTAEPLPTIPGFPFLHPGTGAVIVGPTGGGRSSLIQKTLYDGARLGTRAAYLGFEVTEAEFNARAGNLAELYGHNVNDELRSELARVRYLDLVSVVAQAWEDPKAWIAGVHGSYEVVVIDPLSAVESTLGLNFEQRNTEFIRFWDKLVQPLTSRGVNVTLIENVGHALEARSRAKGASAKQDRADLTFSCKLVSSPAGLVIRAEKVRTVRAAFRRNDEWIFYRDTQTIEARATAGSGAAPTFRPTHFMERISLAVETTPGLSKRAIREAVRGKATAKDLALDLLIADGYIEACPTVSPAGGTRGTHHRSLKPYRKAQDEQSASPDTDSVSHRVPTVSPPCPEPHDGDRVPVSPIRSRDTQDTLDANPPQPHPPKPTRPPFAVDGAQTTKHGGRP